MEKKYLICRMRGRVFSFLFHDWKAVEIHCDPQEDQSLHGSIYIAKVRNVAKNIDAAFLEIEPGLRCYLPLSDLQHPIYTKKGASASIQMGDELLVQVSREDIKTKYPSVSTNITLHGKYVLLTTGNRTVSMSSKLSKEKKEELSAFAAQPEGEARAYGLLFRTNAEHADERRIRAELEALQNKYEALMAQVQYRTCYSCLLRNPPAYLARLDNLYDHDASQIMTDDEQIFHEMRDYVSERHPEDLRRLALYRDPMQSMEKRYSLDTHLAEALKEKVWLKSGGYLIIQPTEALTVIDVNSGKYEGGKHSEAAYLKVNLEAAKEAARQIRLRNISGIIIIDFINMKEEQSNAALLSFLGGELKRDPVPASLIDMTKLSLVEITRKKKEKPLAECCRALPPEELCEE